MFCKQIESLASERLAAELNHLLFLHCSIEHPGVTNWIYSSQEQFPTTKEPSRAARFLFIGNLGLSCVLICSTGCFLSCGSLQLFICCARTTSLRSCNLSQLRKSAESQTCPHRFANQAHRVDIPGTPVQP